MLDEESYIKSLRQVNGKVLTMIFGCLNQIPQFEHPARTPSSHASHMLSLKPKHQSDTQAISKRSYKR